MLLAIDIGNTNIVVGLFEEKTLTISWRFATLHDCTAAELWVPTNRLFVENKVDTRQLDGIIFSSVVPAITKILIEMVLSRLGQDPLCVNADNAGIRVRYENPEEVGADRLVNAIAARTRHGQTGGAVIVIDFGTATTFDVVSASGDYLGGLICPGVEISADALFQRTARLPRVDVKKPTDLIGRTTVASMRSGLFFGYVSMVEGIVQRLQRQLAGDVPAICVATGGLAKAVTAETDIIDYIDLDLTLYGLQMVWERNKGKRSGQ